MKVHQDGNDLVAEALLGEAADLQVALGERRIFLHQSFGEIAVDLVDEVNEVVPFVFIEVEVEGRGGDLLGEGEGGHIHLVFLQFQLQLVLHLLGFQLGTECFLSQQQQYYGQGHDQAAEDEVEIEAFQLLLSFKVVFLHL